MTPLDAIVRSCREHPLERRTRNCGVYFLVEGDEIVYVGSSTDIETRLEAHAAGGKHCGPREFDRVLWISIPASLHPDYEGTFIRALAPRDNHTAPSSRGNDAEILEGFGLPPPQTDAHAEWIRRLRAKTGRLQVPQ